MVNPDECPGSGRVSRRGAVFRFRSSFPADFWRSALQFSMVKSGAIPPQSEQRLLLEVPRSVQ